MTVVVLTPKELEALLERAVSKALAKHQPETAPKPSWLTRAEAAERLGIHPDTLARSDAPRHKIGNRLRFRLEEIDEWAMKKAG